MLNAACKIAGDVLAVPDVCKIPGPPPIPTPFPNMAQCASAQGVTTAVKILNQPVLHKMSKIPMSSGDEAGSAGGVVSGMIKGEVKFTKGSAVVKVEGQAIVYLTCPTQHNGSNANAPQGALISPSQSIVLVAM